MNMLKVPLDVDYETRSRTSLASIFEDLVSLRKSFLGHRNSEVLVMYLLIYNF